MPIFGVIVTALLLTLMVGTSQSAGVDFTLSRPEWKSPTSRVPCGVLLCETDSLGFNGNNSGSITAMIIFKTQSSGPGRISNSNSNPRDFKIVASMSPTQSKLDQISDGRKISGLLKDGQATLRVELRKHADCSAEYICQVQEVDNDGKELVTSSRLLQPQDQNLDNTYETSLKSSLLVRLLSLIQGLDVKLAVMEKTFERLEDKLNSLERFWDDKSGTFKAELQDKIYNLEKTLEDKVTTNFQKMNDKLCQLESKLSAIDSDAIQQEVLNTIQSQVDVHFSKLLNTSERTAKTLNRTATLVTSFNTNNTNFQNSIMDRYQVLFDNVTTDVDDLLTRGRNLTMKIENNLIILKDDVDLRMQRLESSTNESVVKSLASLETVISELNSSLVDNIESLMIGLSMPEKCQKNTPIINHPNKTPYPVIYKSEILGVDSPILCDTVTEGGGWIIIQRRSTGDVDFYRDWDTYKRGFGNLDTDFWLGNENIHIITSSGEYELRVELRYQGQSKFAVYDRFSLAGESDNYRISLGKYSGIAGNALGLGGHNGQQFTTFDRDNDKKSGENCAKIYTGAWWYNACHSCNLNGKWQAVDYKGLTWYSFTTGNPVSFSEMKIRRVK
ncbi:hypothetical protein RRG08_017223 [Elysia crispata]|uniref:Fibrinogen C-terminal domain-containing protein n=1 Tax=Elysia crispata TaxID=231223 RepID=A0AAE1CQ18_9GAST|nr:hypothetical protein RRG08_017223 [Elysia crispata]